MQDFTPHSSLLIPHSSLYIHVPFCAGACDYCDFYSIAIDPVTGRNVDGSGGAKGYLDAYVERLLEDAEEIFRVFPVEYVPSVYIGGGTPSILGADRIKKILAGIKSILSALPGQSGAILPVEITVEANPESVDEKFLDACRNGEVTRISAGVQSFYEFSRIAVHRVGDLSSRQIEKRLELISSYYPGSFSVDLIAGLPLQNEAQFLDDIKRVMAFDPGHISLYTLIVEENTPLARRIRSKSRTDASVYRINTEETDSMWLSGRDYLINAGLQQYEVSNFAKTGKQSLHNIRYWRMENWLGLGPGASGTVIDDETGTGRRYTVIPDVDQWLAKKPSVQEEFLDRQVLIKESLLMGFRYTIGPDPVLFRKRFGIELADLIPQTLENWRKKGYMKPDALALNPNGLLFLNRFLIEAFKELENS